MQYLKYAPLKIAICRMGAPTKAANTLGLAPTTLCGWFSTADVGKKRKYPSDHTLALISSETNIALQCLLDYKYDKKRWLHRERQIKD